MARASGSRLEIKSDLRGHYDVQLDGEPISNAISRVQLDLQATGDSVAYLTIPAPIVTLSALELPAVHVYRAQLISTLDIDPGLDGLTAESYSIPEALEALLAKVRAMPEGD